MDLSHAPPGPEFVAILGATEAEVPILAELQRISRVQVVGVYDPRSGSVGLELAEILGIPFGSDASFLDQVAAAARVVLPRDRHRLEEAIAELQARGTTLIEAEELLTELRGPARVTSRRGTSPFPRPGRAELESLEQSVQWIQKALDREELLRWMLVIAVQAAGATQGSVQLLDAYTQELYVAYAEGLSAHTVRSSRQSLGEGIAGRVAATRCAELIEGLQGRAGERDRSDIQSAVCAPLVDGDRILGVVNASTNVGERRLTPEDLNQLVGVAERMAPVLGRLLEIQSVLDRTLVEDFERELDRLCRLGATVEETLAVLRELLEDLSAADSAELVILTEDGPALEVLPRRAEDGRPCLRREQDPSKGILGQVLVEGSPVVLEERYRSAGESESQRRLTLYVPIGGRDAFAVTIFRFEALRALSPFQRNLERLRDILVPRLGTILAQHQATQRTNRLRVLAEGLAEVPTHPVDQRFSRLLALLMEVTRAQAVALWTDDEVEPTAEMRRGPGPRPREFWAQLRERLGPEGTARLRELDHRGAALRSVLMVRDAEGRVLAAINREPEDHLAEFGFRTEDQEAAQMILVAAAQVDQSLHSGQDSETSVAVPPTPDVDRLLFESVRTELRRAQRYHFSFSLTRFTVEGLSEEDGADRLREVILGVARDTDTLYWRGEEDFVVLAPEETRGQRRLVARYRESIERAFDTDFASEVRVHSQAACYPRDAEDPVDLLRKCGIEAGSPGAD